MKPRKPSLLALALLTGLAFPAFAEDQPARPDSGGEQRAQRSTPGILSLLPADSTSEHALEGRTRRIAYTATAGTLPIIDQSGERKAAVFYTSYVARDANAASRPVTFVFNGGPGAASVYLHLGVVGPKILDFGPTGRDGASARLRDK